MNALSPQRKLAYLLSFWIAIAAGTLIQAALQVLP